MTRRDRAKAPQAGQHPAWQWAQQAVSRYTKAAGIVAGAALLGGLWLGHYVQSSPYFWVSTIAIQLEPGQRWVAEPRVGYRVNPPVHMLKADLKALASAIHREHPQFANVIVRRQLPNRLMAQVTLRQPVGQLRARQYHLVSSDGMILTQGSLTAWEGLPVFLIGSRTMAYQPGQSCSSPELRQAMAVLGEVQRSKALGSRRVSAVRVNPALSGSFGGRLVTLVLDNGLELRATPGDLAPRLLRLGELLNGKGRELEQAQYVDLRFDDLVVGLKSDD